MLVGTVYLEENLFSSGVDDYEGIRGRIHKGRCDRSPCRVWKDYHVLSQEWIPL